MRAGEMMFDCEKFAVYDEKMKEYYATLALDDEPQVRKLIERYDDHVFWGEAVKYLGERDFFAQYTKDELENMSHEERMEKLWACESKWDEEFATYGMKRLCVYNGDVCRTKKE